MDIAEKHSEFLAEFAAELGHFFEVASSDIDRTSGFIEWFGEKVFEHAYNHGVEDAAKSSQELKIHPTIDEQVIRHTEVPFDGDVSSQEDIKAFWDEREKQKAGTPEDSRSSY